jgi:hypothetical protein
MLVKNVTAPARRRTMDALDARRPRQQMSKKEKQAYAKEKAMEELVTPPKNPPPAWLSNPALLPKKPPGRR